MFDLTYGEQLNLKQTFMMEPI